MKRLALYLGIAVALAASCTVQEKEFRTPNQDGVVFYTSFEKLGEEGTKVYVNEGLHLRWNANDRVSIFNKNTYNQQYMFLGETGDNAGGFAKVDGAEFVTGNPLANVVSVYPYQESTKITEDGKLTVILPAEQHYAKNTFGLKANTMVSVSADNFLQYKNVGGFLRVSLYGEGVSVSSITLRGNNGEKLAGKATVSMPLDGTPIATMGEDAVTEITLLCDTPVELGALAEESVNFWFVVPPVTFSQGFTLSVTQITGVVFEKTTTKTITIDRNRISKMSSTEVVANNPGPIIIDGDFSDWDKLDASKIAIAKSDPNSPWDAVTEIRVYANEKDAFFYLEFDDAQIAHLLADKDLAIRLNLNTDGEVLSGINRFSLDHYDFFIEGRITSEGHWSSFDGPLYLADGLDHILQNEGMCSGTGCGGKYEFSLSRDAFNTAVISSGYTPMSDAFQVGIHFYSIEEANWDELANIPNGIISDDNPNGYGHLLDVITDKPYTISVPEAIDLGLSVKWASFNLGASKPEEYGDYYAWGEIDPYYEPGFARSVNTVWKSGKEDGYSWSSYKWCKGSQTTMTKYCSNSSFGLDGFVDGKITLDPEDDAAHMNLGGNWRMPTREEWIELFSWESGTSVGYTSLNGVGGVLVIGTNGNSIFIPYSGNRDGTVLYPLCGYYWSSSLLSNSNYGEYEYLQDHTKLIYGERFWGLSIRPVYAE